MAALDFSGWQGDAAVLCLFIVFLLVPALLIPACRRLIARMESEGR